MSNREPEASATIRWEPRISRALIWRLYQSDAEGRLDEELLDEVAWGLLARSQSMLEVTETLRGHAKCFGCGGVILHAADAAAQPPQVVLQCSACGWETTWGEYFRSFTGRHLRAGFAEAILEHFVQAMHAPHSSAKKMRLVDGALHEFHKDLLRHDTKSLAICLLDGRSHDILELLDTLAYGPQSTPGLQEVAAGWRQRREKMQKSPRRR